MDDEDIREKAYRYVVYSSIGFSVIATLSAGLTLFMASSSVANFENKMYKDVVFCKVNEPQSTGASHYTLEILLHCSRIRLQMCFNKFRKSKRHTIKVTSIGL